MAMLGKANACCAMLGVGRVDCQTCLIAGVTFGQAGSFDFCKGNDVVKEQVLTITQPPELLFNVLVLGYLVLPAVLLWVVHD